MPQSGRVWTRSAILKVFSRQRGGRAVKAGGVATAMQLQAAAAPGAVLASAEPSLGSPLGPCCGGGCLPCRGISRAGVPVRVEDQEDLHDRVVAFNKRVVIHRVLLLFCLHTFRIFCNQESNERQWDEFVGLRAHFSWVNLATASRLTCFFLSSPSSLCASSPYTEEGNARIGP